MTWKFWKKKQTTGNSGEPESSPEPKDKVLEFARVNPKESRQKWSIFYSAPVIAMFIGIIGCGAVAFSIYKMEAATDKPKILDSIGSVISPTTVILSLLGFLCFVFIACWFIRKAWREAGKRPHLGEEQLRAGNDSTPKVKQKEVNWWKLLRVTAACLIVLLIAFWAIRTWWGPGGASQRANNAPIQPGLYCPGENGISKVFRYKDFSKGEYDVDIPMFPSGLGCWSLMITPDKWGSDWSVSQLNADPEWKIYFKTPDGKIQGPYGWNDRPALKLPHAFYIQATKAGGKMHFHSDAVEATIAVAAAEIPVETEPPSAAEAHVYKVGEEGVVAPKVLKEVNPEYTEEARRANFSGKVSVDAIVDENGDLTDITIANPPGFGLDDKIVEAAKKWKLKPGSKDGVAVPVQAKLSMQFKKF